MANRSISPSLGVCYYPEHWPESEWINDAKRMVEVGISYVRIAEFAWSRIEPRESDFQFEWLDKAIETLGSAGLKVVMCTPTATPPKWVVDKVPDMVAVDVDGHPRKFGSRRHYCFSHAGYRAECARITEILAKRYGENPHVVAWQTDNEFGCHDTTISYSTAVRDGFRMWLRDRYKTIDRLNAAWGGVFWSMEFTDFEQVPLPNLTVTEANPTHRLDFARYSSDQVVAFNRVQTDLLRQHSPGRDIIHNFMGKYLEFDHFDVSADLDIASWDSYPLGFLEQFGRDDDHKARYMRAGDPDFQAFHHDLYRACGAQRDGALDCGNGRWWVMEQQPGPVNWAPWNPSPHAGMARLWAHEAFAHGAEVISYFRWRQAPFAQEQMHTGLNRPDGSPDIAYFEAQQVGQELANLPDVKPQQAKVALVFDYQAMWAASIQPQGADFDAFELCLAFYSALRRMGLSIDILPPDGDPAGYALVVAPFLPMVQEGLINALKQHQTLCLFGPRSGSRTEDHHVPSTLAPGLLQKLLPMRVERLESLRPGAIVPVGNHGHLHRWREHISGDVSIEIEADDGYPVHVSHQNAHYLGGWPSDGLLDLVLEGLVSKADLDVLHLPEGVRVRDRGKLRYVLNYGEMNVDVDALIDGERIMGESKIGAAGVAVFKL